MAVEETVVVAHINDELCRHRLLRIQVGETE